MRKIFFLKYYDKGSTAMGADQISAALVERGVESRTVYPRDLPGIREGLIVAIKTSKIQHLLAARARGNRVILDVQDTVVFKRWIKNKPLFDGLIFKNARQLADFGSPRQICRVIYHQWDPRYRPNEVGPGGFEVGYFGLQRSLPPWGQGLPKDIAFYEDDWFDNALRFNCHLSLREPGRDFLYKPNCKVSTAAACLANLVTTRDESALELLGPDYPYYAEPSADGVAAAIDRARSTVGGPEWRRGLDRLREVREKTSLSRVIDGYLAYFELFG